MNRKTASIAVLALLVAALSASLAVAGADLARAVGQETPTRTPTPEPSPPPAGTEASDSEWELLWSDEFDAEAAAPIDDTYWTCQLGGHGWGNAQLEYNTDRIENVAHDGAGHLVITAREEMYLSNKYTSARCNTSGKFEFTYGKVEARIDVPEGQGIWPAFWMLGADMDDVGWPNAGEIDIMEYIGREPRTTYGTVHGPGYSGAAGKGSSRRFSENVADDFHIFGIEWGPDIIRWYVDGRLFYTVTPAMLGGSEWVFDHDFYLLINVAVGGYWPGYPDETTEFPQHMLIDWIRVYQTGDTSSAGDEAAGSVTPTATP